MSQEAVNKATREGLIRWDDRLNEPLFLSKYETLGADWTDIPGYSQSHDFPTENSEELLQRVIEASSNRGDFVLDYFLGSGTTTAVAQKLGRKWIGVEMGEFFEKIPLVRMKKVLYGEKSGISKEANWQGGGFFKYQYLEQYEDTLHNIEFPNEGKAQQVLKLFDEGEASEYLMKYMLRFETDGSSSLLDLKQLENPFDYKLRIISGGKGEQIANIDLIETFNYLIGLKVNKYGFSNEDKRKYVFVLGERNSKRVAVIWRATRDIDLERDKVIIEDNIRSFQPDETFINGDSLVKDYRPIESELKTLMAR